MGAAAACGGELLTVATVGACPWVHTCGYIPVGPCPWVRARGSVLVNS